MSVKQNRAAPVLPAFEQTPSRRVRSIAFGLYLQHEQPSRAQPGCQLGVAEESSSRIGSRVHSIWRIREDEIELFTGTRQVGEDITLKNNSLPLHPGSLDIFFHYLHGGVADLDEYSLSSSPAQSLDPEGAGPGEEVQDAGAFQTFLQHAEKRLA